MHVRGLFRKGGPRNNFVTLMLNILASDSSPVASLVAWCVAQEAPTQRKTDKNSKQKSWLVLVGPSVITGEQHQYWAGSSAGWCAVLFKPCMLHFLGCHRRGPCAQAGKQTCSTALVGIMLVTAAAAPGFAAGTYPPPSRAPCKSTSFE